MKTKRIDFVEKLIESGEITINSELEKLQNVVLFPEKLEMANQFIKKHGLPKKYYDQMAKKKEENKE